MKKQLLTLSSIVAIGFTIQAQNVADFENLPLPAGSYWTGTASSADSAFDSGDAKFLNKFGSYWDQGWAYSNVEDSTTVGYTNNYGARTGSGYGNSDNYAVGKNGAKVYLTSSSENKEAVGMYVTNGTYAALSMQNGDPFAKKFGGTTGTDEDWFLMTIKGYRGGSLILDSVNFYLADFRSADITKDYIVKDWRWVDLQSLGNVDSLVFSLNSSDVGQWGMNTPGFFCMDDFTTTEFPSSIEEEQGELFNAYPNPVANILNIQNVRFGSSVQLVDITGKVLIQKTASAGLLEVDMTNLTSGIYLLNVISNGIFTQEKIVKK